MSADSNNYFGFETLHKLIENQVHKKEDVIIVFAHWFFAKSGFRCIGLGDSKTFNSNETGTELLPEGWSENDHYALRYLKDGQLYILLGRKSDGDLLLNLLRIADNSLSTIKFPVNATIAEQRGALSTMLPDYDEVHKKLQKELLEPVYTGTAREISTQTAPLERGQTRNPPADGVDPLRVAPPPRHWEIPDPRNVGRNDLDPFGGIGPRIGGGMLYDPFSNQRPAHGGPGPLPGGLGGPARLPHGAIPPGARFDPFGPPDVVQPRPRRFDPDGAQPPPDYNDMFM